MFPGGRPPSIFGAKKLNFCVRDGNRCILLAIITSSSSKSPSLITKFVYKFCLSLRNFSSQNETHGFVLYYKSFPKLLLLFPQNYRFAGALIYNLLFAPLKSKLTVLICVFSFNVCIEWRRVSFLTHFRSSPRPISIGQLNMLPYLHLRPIYHIVYVGSYFF